RHQGEARAEREPCPGTAVHACARQARADHRPAAQGTRVEPLVSRASVARPGTQASSESATPGSRLSPFGASGTREGWAHAQSRRRPAFLAPRSALPRSLKTLSGSDAMPRTKPPFRADHVGSILRSAAIKDARARHEKGALTDAELKAVEDREIDKIIKKQEEVGLEV